MLAGIEAGGTKFVLAVAESPEALVERHVIETRDPETTLGEAAAWIAGHGEISSIGIASFGPLEIDPTRKNWGCITDTPKPGWANCNLAGFFAERFSVPIGFDTDVNGAALAEYRFGAGVGKKSLAYVTVGTGIGGGLVVNGLPLEGAGHLEMGHWYPRNRSKVADLSGYCPFHRDCLEGLVSGEAIRRRWGADLSSLPPEHEAHGIVADYLGQLCHAIFAMTAAEVIVMGGGVMQAPRLLDKVRQGAASIGGYYLPGRERQSIEAPQLGSDSGIIGSLALAEGALSG